MRQLEYHELKKDACLEIRMVEALEEYHNEGGTWKMKLKRLRDRFRGHYYYTDFKVLSITVQKFPRKDIPLDYFLGEFSLITPITRGMQNLLLGIQHSIYSDFREDLSKTKED